MNAIDPSVPNQLVQQKSDPARRGVTTGRVRRAGTRAYAEVEFGPHERKFIEADDLEPVLVANPSVADLLRDLNFGDEGDLARILTFHKISSQLTNVFYAMQASRTDFYAYQFKPVYKFIESANGRILVTDEVGLGKTVEAGLIWLEARARSQARRLLVVCPSMLREKWKQELRFRFNVPAAVYDSRGVISLLDDFRREGDNFSCAAVCSLQTVRQESVRKALSEFDGGPHRFDLVVIDEAHHEREVTAMCGRFAQKSDPKRLAKKFGVAEAPAAEARYNVAPTQEVLCVREGGDGREMTFFQWGLVPSWAKDPGMGARLINARSETVAEKPAFREAFKRRRCIVPADGFYEWQRAGGRKQPYFFRMSDGEPFGFAGLWDRWEGEGGRVINSCTILTTEVNEVVRSVHDRMPVILHPEDYDLWLGDDVRQRDLIAGLLRPYPAGEMTSHPVSPAVNSPRNQGESLIERVEVNSA